jgi:hypothetical protein
MGDVTLLRLPRRIKREFENLRIFNNVENFEDFPRFSKIVGKYLKIFVRLKIREIFENS